MGRKKTGYAKSQVQLNLESRHRQQSAYKELPLVKEQLAKALAEIAELKAKRNPYQPELLAANNEEVLKTKPPKSVSKPKKRVSKSLDFLTPDEQALLSKDKKTLDKDEINALIKIQKRVLTHELEIERRKMLLRYNHSPQGRQVEQAKIRTVELLAAAQDTSIVDGEPMIKTLLKYIAQNNVFNKKDAAALDFCCKQWKVDGITWKVKSSSSLTTNTSKKDGEHHE